MHQLRLRLQKLQHRQAHQRQSSLQRLRMNSRPKRRMKHLQNRQASRTEMRMDHARAARILITETASRADEVSVRERTATTTVTTEAETAADSVRENPRAARDSSAETETVTAREDLQDRAIPRTEARVRVMETDVISVREIIVTTVMEMEADLAREDHRAARDVSEARTKDAVRDASADRTTRAASVPAAQEEAEDPMPSSHRS